MQATLADSRRDSAWVLVIEDCREDFDLIRRAARKPWPSYEFVQAPTGPQALERLQESGILPSLILLDGKLPGMSGIEVLEEIRNLPGCSAVPIVAMSNLDDGDYWRREENTQISAFLEKKVAYEEFVGGIQQILTHWL